MMISFEVEKGKFNFRAACIIFQDNKVLFQQSAGDDHWFLPGGRVEMQEDTTSTIHREIMEEFGLQIRSKQLVWIMENFFKLGESQFHEIGFYYLVRLEGEHLTTDGEFKGLEDGYVNRWIDLGEFNDFRIVPEFIKDELLALEYEKQGKIKHWISREAD